MAVKTVRVDSGDALDRLDRVRLTNDWSYRELSTDMERAGVIVSAQTVHQALTARAAKPYDRTIYKIRQYLEYLDAERLRSAKPARKTKGRAARVEDHP